VLAYISAILFLIGLMMPGRCISLATTELALTDKRVLGRVGLFRRRKLNVPLKNIEVAVAQRGLVGLLCNYGTVTISSKDGNRIKFRGIARPHAMTQQIDKALEAIMMGKDLSVDTVEIRKPVPVLEAPAVKTPEAQAEVGKLRKNPNAW
jgi:hypothetical protein